MIFFLVKIFKLTVNNYLKYENRLTSIAKYGSFVVLCKFAKIKRENQSALEIILYKSKQHLLADSNILWRLLIHYEKVFSLERLNRHRDTCECLLSSKNKPNLYFLQLDDHFL